jgi:hypothetical protein
LFHLGLLHAHLMNIEEAHRYTKECLNINKYLKEMIILTC